MDYREALDYIYSASAFGKKPDVENMRTLLQRLGDPQRSFRVVTVAGTNGKGSTAANIASVALQAGERVGLYTSPYIMRFNDRMRVDGVPVSDEDIAWAATRVKKAAEGLFLKVFELTTAVGMLCFAKAGVTFAVVEVGIGGRFDATKAILPNMTVITAVGFDHTHILGSTLEEIAWNKAGIAAPGAPMVLYPQGEAVRAVVQKECLQVGAPLYDLAQARIEPAEEAGCFSLHMDGIDHVNLKTPLLGDFQLYNAATAAAACGLLGFEEACIRRGLAAVSWEGRMEALRKEPLLMLDGGHNPPAIAALVRNLDSWHLQNLTLLCGFMADKAVEEMVDMLAPRAVQVYTVSPDPKRGLPADVLADMFRARGTAAQPAPVLTRDWLAGHTGPLVVCGSLYLVGDARNLWFAE